MSALTDHPRELSLSQRRGKWVLAIHDHPRLSGEAESSSRALVEALAEAYAALRREDPQ
jgi:hypothetical protein